MRLSIKGTVAALLLTTGPIYGLNRVYRKESKQVFDQARIIEASQFKPAFLRQEFTDFVARECKGRTLARLILAPSQHDLERAVNVIFFDITPEYVERVALTQPSIFGIEGGEPRVAQVLCFGGNATVMIRDGESISRYQISGPHDSRDWNIQGVNATIVGFDVSPVGTPVWMFLRAKVAPTLDVAAGIRDELQDRTGIGTILVLRTDPFFWTVNGPKCDIFDVPVPKISGREYLRKPYIACPQRGSRELCRIQTPH